MAQFSSEKKKREYQDKERQHKSHLSEQSVADVVYRLSEASGGIHDHSKEQKQCDGDQGYAPDHIVVSLVAVASAFYLIEHFLLCRISRIVWFLR